MHRILCQTLDITTATEAAALDLQRALGRAFEGPGRQRLERAFDAACGDDTLYIERLELDLGVIGGRGWLEAFFDRLAEAAEGSIARPEGGAAASSSEFAVRSTGPQGRAQGVVRRDAAAGQVAAVEAYLRLGRLPWWSDIVPCPGWFAKMLAGRTGALVEAVRRLALADSVAMTRLVAALPAPALVRVLTVSRPTLRLPVWVRMAAVLRRGASGQARVDRLRAFWTAIAQGADPATPEVPAMTALARGLAGALAGPGPGRLDRVALARLERQLPETLRRDFATALGDPAITGQRRAADGLKDTGFAPAPKEPVEEVAPVQKPDPDGRGLRQKISGEDVGPPAKTPMPARRTRGAEEDRLVVSDAGLVILHPFLPELFRRCGYWRDGAWTDDVADHAAVRLLGYLAIGQTDTDEAALSLAKLLAGFAPLDDPLLPDRPHSDALARADALIAAVLEHWAALRSASADFLRSQFICRPGHLVRQDDGWVLHVETRAQDVLLGRLPWGFGAIALPWMGEPLSVRWLD